jgi:hypothetical protein
MTSQSLIDTHLNRKVMQSRWSVSAIFFLLYGLIASFYFWVNHEVRPVWLDEALTYYQVTDRSFIELIRSFDYGVNLLPYSYFVFPWAVGKITELDPLALRLPSLLFGTLALLVVHKLIAREFGNLIAFASVFFTFIVASEFQGYLSEARPYSLYTLAAAAHLWSAFALFEDVSRRKLVLNCVTSACLPSVQFVGLVYSFALAVVFMVLEGNRSKALRILSSFCFGWLIFALVHLKLLWIIFSGKSLSDPDAFARPTLTRTAQEFNQFFDIPAEVSVCLVALIVLAVFVNRKSETSGVDQLAANFTLPSLPFVGASVAWLMVPLGLKLIAALGFFNLTVPRYLLPTLIADAMLVGTFLSVVYQFINCQSETDSDRWISKHGPLLARLILSSLLLLAVVENLGIQLRVVAAGRTNGTDFFAKKIKGNVAVKLPLLTTDAHNFMPYAYHTRKQKDLDLSLVSPEAELPLWKAFVPDLNITELNEFIARHDHFVDNDALLGRLIKAGYGLENIPSPDGNEIYLVDRRSHRNSVDPQID